MEVSNGGLRFPDVREDQRAGLSRSDEGRVARTVRTYVKHPRLVRVGRIATTCIDKTGKHYYVNKRRYDVSS
jgi:hypothetical protein